MGQSCQEFHFQEVEKHCHCLLLQSSRANVYCETLLEDFWKSFGRIFWKILPSNLPPLLEDFRFASLFCVRLFVQRSPAVLPLCGLNTSSRCVSEPRALNSQQHLPMACRRKHPCRVCELPLRTSPRGVAPPPCRHTADNLSCHIRMCW